MAVIMEMTHTKPNTEWPVRPIGELLRRVRQPVDVQLGQTYQEIGIRSHCKGIFHKTPTTGEEIGNKRVFWVEPGCLIFNIIFAWEQAVAMTSENEAGMIASHRFPMYTSRNGKLLPEYAWRYFSSPRGKYDLGIASPGGAGRNKTLGQAEFDQLKIPVPPIAHQRMTVDTLAVADRAIARIEDLIAAKRKLKEGLDQQLLSGKCRLLDYDSTWTEYRLGALFKERRESNCVDLPLLSVTRKSGVVPHSDANRKDSSAQDKSKYKRIMPGDIGYNTMRMWQGISALSGLEGIISPAYTVCIPNTRISGSFARHLFKFSPIVHLFYRYSQGLVSDTWSLKFRHFAQIRVRIPSIREQERIAAILHASDCQIQLLEKKLVALIELKRGLMQKLFASYTSKVRLARGENHNAS